MGGFPAGGDISTEADATTSVLLGDVDGDGHLDMVVGNDNLHADRLYLNDGSGAFSLSADMVAENLSTLSTDVGDLDNDGDIDLVAGANAMSKIRRFINAAACVLCAGVAQAQSPVQEMVPSYTIQTIAGDGTQATTGDGSAATSAQVHGPTGVWVDGSGNVYIAEYTGHTVRKIDGGTGVITTIAGTGSPGSTGDGGPATSATLNAPYGVSVDASGNVYIAELSGGNIRKIDAGTGNISTLLSGRRVAPCASLSTGRTYT